VHAPVKAGRRLSWVTERGGAEMRIVIALGGNALLRRGEPMTTGGQRANVKIAAQAIAPLAATGNGIVVVHGNGPQVGLLPPEIQVATLLTMVVVDPGDPAFASPAKFVGPVYGKDAADALTAKKGWTFRPDGPAWRGVVPSPEPRQILEVQPISWLLERGALVICAGGEGIPIMAPSPGPGAVAGVEAVIDKDLASELLAEDLGVDLFLMATDVDGAYLRWGTPEQRRLGDVTPGELAGLEFAAGSMGPKVEAAARFVTKTGRRAAIGSLADIAGIVAGTAGTNVVAQKSARRRRSGSLAGR
jgi:carbamate kinase